MATSVLSDKTTKQSASHSIVVVAMWKDVKKMPLGKISKSQIAKGFEALEKIEDAINNSKTSQLAELSSVFYTLIPHDFGRQRPPTISNSDTLRRKMDMLMVTSCQVPLYWPLCVSKAAVSYRKKFFIEISWK